MRTDYSGANAIAWAARLRISQGQGAAAFARASQDGYHAGTAGHDFWHRVACVLETGGPSDQAVRDAEAELERRRREFMRETPLAAAAPDVAQRNEPSHDVTPSIEERLKRADDVFAAARRAGNLEPDRPWWAKTGAQTTLTAGMTREAFEAHEAAEAAVRAQEQEPPPAAQPATIAPLTELKQEKLF